MPATALAQLTRQELQEQERRGVGGIEAAEPGRVWVVGRRGRQPREQLVDLGKDLRDMGTPVPSWARSVCQADRRGAAS
jgi:hypothetical protein